MATDDHRSIFDMASGACRLFCIFFALILISARLQGSTSFSVGIHKSGRSSVFSLFNLKEKSRYWSEAIFQKSSFNDLESSLSGQFEVSNYTRAGNLANYLMLKEVNSVYIPVPVNFIFIGFEGKGNHEFKLHPEELERWFMKIDHVFERSWISHVKEKNYHPPLVSHINYNFSVRAIQLGEKVTHIFERAIHVFGHRDGHSDDGDAWQVDVDMMGILFTSLIDHLQLHNAYNIFVLNPKCDTKHHPKYGYRSGLSELELSFLKENRSLQEKILNLETTHERVLELFEVLDKIARPFYGKHPMIKFSWSITEETDTVEWYNICLDVLNKMEKLYEGKDFSDIIMMKVLETWKDNNEAMKVLFKKELASVDFHSFQVDCLTDIWVGHKRWAFIDLSAGPFSWGPAVGGDGVRTEISLPNVQKIIGSIAEVTEDEAEHHLQEVIEEKFSPLGDKDHQAIDILLAEIDVYEIFAMKHCFGRKVKLALCEELEERMRDLKDEFHSFENEDYTENHKKKAIEALKRMEKWNLFSGSQEETENYSVARDMFLAHLGSTLSGFLRHVCSPSVADGTFHYYEKMSFQLYFITQEKVQNIKHLPVDLRALKEGLSSLLVSSQAASFSDNLLALSEDHALAMAFSVARRAAAVPLLLVNGTYRVAVRSYLDSSILQYQLQRLNGHASLKGGHAHGISTIEVPIFWFINNEPLLIDKFDQAKALPNMVIVVQSDQSSWESHLQCNGQSLFLDLRKPMKAALAAVSEHLAGVLPLHLVYSHSHDTAIQDWTWSVGSNPFSITSRRWQFSQFHSDAIARNYLTGALEESIQSVNSAILLLLKEHTSEKSFRFVHSQEWDIVTKYNFVVNLWRRISTITGELHFVEALRLLHALKVASKRFSDKVDATLAELGPIQCTTEREVHGVVVVAAASLLLCALVVAHVAWKPRKRKPKIN